MEQPDPSSPRHISDSLEQLAVEGFENHEPATAEELDERDRAQELQDIKNAEQEILGREQSGDMTAADLRELSTLRVARITAERRGKTPMSREEYEAQIDNAKDRHPTSRFKE